MALPGSPILRWARAAVRSTRNGSPDVPRRTGRSCNPLQLRTPGPACRDDFVCEDYFDPEPPAEDRYPECKPVPIPPRAATNSLGAPVSFARGSMLYVPDLFDRCRDDDWMSDRTADASNGWYPTVSGVPFAAGTVHVPKPGDLSQCDRGWPYPTWPHLDMTAALGYSVGWLIYTLRFSVIDTISPPARAAFVGSPAEMLGNANWEAVTLRNLP
jgi:hypothetical protein